MTNYCPAFGRYSLMVKQLCFKICLPLSVTSQWLSGSRDALSLRSEDSMDLNWIKSMNSLSPRILGSSTQYWLKQSVAHQLQSWITWCTIWEDSNHPVRLCDIVSAVTIQPSGGSWIWRGATSQDTTAGMLLLWKTKLCISDKLPRTLPLCLSRKESRRDLKLWDKTKELISGKKIGWQALAWLKDVFTHFRMGIVKECTDTVWRVESGLVSIRLSDETY